jgi:Amt family ammonium transporter
MSTDDLLISISTVWVLIAAFFVMFMQAGFAFLEAGLTRMKNVGHIAAKNAIVLALASIVYYLVGFGMAFGDSNGDTNGGGSGFQWSDIIGNAGYFPTTDQLLAIGEEPFSWFGAIPGAAGYMFEVVFAAVSLAIVWGAMAERTRLWVYFAFGVVFTLIYSFVSHWIWSPDGWLFTKGMQDFAGSTVVHYQGALAGLAGAILLGPRIGKYGADKKPNAIPGHNMAFTTLGVIILWFGWFGFNPGSTLGVEFGGIGFYAYVALNTNLAAAAGVIGALLMSMVMIKKPDLSMMLNGAIGGLVAITAACAFVAPWAAIVIGLVAGCIVVLGVLGVERIGLDDPIGAISAHGMSGLWGTLSLGFLTVPALATSLETGEGGLFYGGGLHQLWVQVQGLLAVGAFTFTASFVVLWIFKKTIGIRTHHEDEEIGLDVSEHGMWGYPEFFIPVPGGYGSEPTVPVGQQFSDGEVIVAEGTRGDSMYVVQSGKVEIVHKDESGTEHVLGTLKTGEFFGEMAIFENEVRSATVRSVGDTVVLEVDKRTVQQRIQENPGLAVNMLKTMSSRLRGANTMAHSGTE